MRVDLDKYRRAGRIAARVRDEALAAIRPGVRIVDVLDQVETSIRDQGAGIAFPAQISVNEVAAHDCCGPEDERAFQEGDVAKLDLGVHLEGCIADTAGTVDLGQHAGLLQASKDALEAAIERVRPGARLRDIGAAIQGAMQAHRLQPVANLTGHGIAPYTIHCAPSIPNVPDGTRGELKVGMMICIEPFSTTGRGYIEERGQAEVFAARRKLKAPRSVDPALVQQIAARRGMPFCRRELAREHGIRVAERALRDLLRAGSIHAYPPLVEQPGAKVAQFEHTMFVGPDGTEVMTR